MMYDSARLKLKLELILMWPLILLGKIIGVAIPLKTHHNTFFLLPNQDIGGSPQVNLDLLACFIDKNPIVIFTKKGRNNLFAEHYKKLGIKTIDIHKWTDNKALHFLNIIVRGMITRWIHANKNVTVFGGECIFFYKVAPHLKASINKVELCHLPTWIGYTKAFAPYITTRVTSTAFLRRTILAEYGRSKVPAEYFEKIRFVENAIDIPALSNNKNNQLEVFFIGRGAPQKRIHLIGKIAKKANEASLPLHFNFVGDVENYIDKDDFFFCSFYGNVKDQTEMKNIYEKADVLLLTSKNEGLPVVVMQMMAMGKIVVSTAVDALPDYIEHDVNGYLLTSENEKKIVEEGLNIFSQICHHPEQSAQIGSNAREMAVEKFNRENFCKIWREIFNL